MVTRVGSLLICIVFGAVVATVCSTAKAVAVDMRGNTAMVHGSSPAVREDVTSLVQTPISTSFAVLPADGATRSMLDAKRKIKDIGTLSALRQTPLDLSARGLDKSYGLIGEDAEDLQLPLDANCPTNIILAAFFKSRFCRTGTLIVAATSELMNEANLKLSDYGRMKWDRKNQIWLIRVRDLETNPGTVLVVDGTECTIEAQVLTVPYGCDAKLYPDTANDY